MMGGWAGDGWAGDGCEATAAMSGGSLDEMDDQTLLDTICEQVNARPQLMDPLLEWLSSASEGSQLAAGAPPQQAQQKGAASFGKKGGGKQAAAFGAAQSFGGKGALGSAAPKGGVKGAIGARPALPAFATPGSVPFGARASPGERFVGTISAVYPDKNYGFIKCPKTFAIHGADLWVHGDQLGSFQVDEAVSFTMILNKAGKPQAIDLAPPNAAVGGKGGALKRPPSLAAQAAESGERYTGVISAIYLEKNFGFIKCPETEALYGKDVWVHGAQFAGYTVNTSCTFTCVLNQKGDPQAIDLAPIGGGKFMKLSY